MFLTNFTCGAFSSQLNDFERLLVDKDSQSKADKYSNIQSAMLPVSHLTANIAGTMVSAPKFSCTISDGSVAIFWDNELSSVIKCSDVRSYKYETMLADAKAVIAHLLDCYEYGVQYAICAKQLTEYVQGILKEEEIPYNVEFRLSQQAGILEITNNSICLGITLSTLLNWATQYKMHYAIEQCDIYRESVVASFVSLANIIECVHRKTAFMQSLDLYTWKHPSTLLKNVYTRSYDTIKTGKCYFIQGDLYTAFDKRTCTDAELAEMQSKYGANLLVLPNSQPAASDYIVAKNADELERAKKRLNKKGLAYTLIEKPNKLTGELQTLLVYKPHLAVGVLYGPVNLDTYATDTINTSDILDY